MIFRKKERRGVVNIASYLLLDSKTMLLDSRSSLPAKGSYTWSCTSLVEREKGEGRRESEREINK